MPSHTSSVQAHYDNSFVHIEAVVAALQDFYQEYEQCHEISDNTIYQQILNKEEETMFEEGHVLSLVELVLGVLIKQTGIDGFWVEPVN